MPINGRSIHLQVGVVRWRSRNAQPGAAPGQHGCGWLARRHLSDGSLHGKDVQIWKPDLPSLSSRGDLRLVLQPY